MKSRKMITAGLLSLVLAASPAAAAENTEVFADQNFIKDGSIELVITGSASGTGEDISDINSILQLSNIDLILTKSSDQILGDLSVNVMESAIVHALGSLDNTKAAFSFPEVNNNKYVYPLEGLTDALKNADGDNPLQLKVQSGPQISPEEYKQVLTPYLETFTDFFEENSQKEEWQIELQLLQKTTEGTSVVIDPTADQLASLMNTFADQIEKDDELQRIASEWADYYEKMTSAAENAGADLNSNDTSLPEEANPDNIEALRNLQTEAPKMLRESASELQGQDLGDFLNVQYGLTGEGKLCRIAVNIANVENEYSENGTEESTGSPLNFEYENLDGQLCAAVTYEGNTYQFTASYQNEGKKYSGSCAFDISGMQIADCTYNFDASEKTVLGIPNGSADFNIMGLALTLSVTENTDGTDTTLLNINGINAVTGDESLQGLLIRMDGSSGAQAAVPEGAEVDLSAMEQDEINSTIEELGNGIQTYAEQVLSSLGQ